MAEIQYNPDVEAVIRSNLAATKRWEWTDDDRKWAAIGSAITYFRDYSTMSEILALGLAEKITTEIMREEEEQAAQGDETPGDDYESIETYIQEINERDQESE